ncbi:hypothetical protein QFC19_009272 [Naganishia cerealis]|uniref:Uncharacterized protein n=1 Tax=Naganishia cerealis TaxID=610337 RepID=A0ACC2UWI1_9TREE|nr:hypothetical protein QFC19_009272 [Naganishia cerealis]
MDALSLPHARTWEENAGTGGLALAAQAVNVPLIGDKKDKELQGRISSQVYVLCGQEMDALKGVANSEDGESMNSVTHGFAGEDSDQAAKDADQAEGNHHEPSIEGTAESLGSTQQTTNPPMRKQLRVYTHNSIPTEQQEQVVFINERGLPVYNSQQSLYATAPSPSIAVSPLPNHMMPQEIQTTHAGPPSSYYIDADSVFQAQLSQPAATPMMNKSARLLRPGFKRAESMLEPRVMGNLENSPLGGHAGVPMSSASNQQHGMTIIRPESTPVASSQRAGYHTAYFIQHPMGDANGQYMSYQLADGQQVYMAQSPFVQTGVQVRSLMPDNNPTFVEHHAHSPMLHAGMATQHLTQPHGGFMMSRSHSDPFAFNMHGVPSDTVAMESIVGQNVFCTPMNKQMLQNGFADSPAESMGDGESTVASTAKKGIHPPPPQSARSLTPMSAYSTADSSYPPSMSGKYRTSLMNGEDGVEEELEEEEELARRGMGRASSIARLVHNQGSPTRQPKGRITRPGQLRRANTLMEQSTTANTTISSRRKVKGQASADALEEIKSRDAGRKAPHGLGTKSSAAAKSKEYVPENIPPGPRSSEKPPWSYAALIGQAILASTRKRLALSQIYAWISTAYPYFKPGDAGWMNSIRHNLSLNDCFVKGERGEEDAGGKGSVWMIDPAAEFQFRDGGFKKASKAKAEAAAAAAAGSASMSSDVKKSGQSSSRKRKVTEIEPIPPRHIVTHMQQQPFLQPLMIPVQVDSGHHPLSYASMPLPHSNSPGLQASPIPPELELSKRLKFEDGEMSAISDSASRPATSHESRHNSSFNGSRDMQSSQNGLSANSNLSNATDESSPFSTVEASTPAINDRSPEALQSQRKPSFMHRSALDKTAARPQIPSNIADDTFSTPNRPLSVEAQYNQPSSGIFGMLPHLTPSASSPISSSPAPSTITKVGLMDRRMAQLSELRRPDTVRIRAAKDEFSSDPVMSDGVKHTTFSIGLAPAAQLNGGTFVEPALPNKAKRHPDSLDLAKQSERKQVTLSPMHQAHRRVKSVTLPGPSELLSNSPKAADRTGLSSDPLNHLDRLPKSPIGRPKSPSDKFATPVAPNQRTRLVNFTPRTLSGITATPMRTSTLGNLLPHQTPAGLMKAQFKAEHGLLDSPMGLSGSCYDMSDASYRVDCELEHLQTRGLQSPTTSYGHQRYQSVVFGYEHSP